MIGSTVREQIELEQHIRSAAAAASAALPVLTSPAVRINYLVLLVSVPFAADVVLTFSERNLCLACTEIYVEYLAV